MRVEAAFRSPPPARENQQTLPLLCTFVAMPGRCLIQETPRHRLPDGALAAMLGEGGGVDHRVGGYANSFEGAGGFVGACPWYARCFVLEEAAPVLKDGRPPEGAARLVYARC